MVVSKGEEIQSEYALRINKEKIKTQSLVHFLRVKSDNKLKFTDFFPKKLEIKNSRIQKYLDQK